VIEHLPSKIKTLSSTLSIAKTKTKNKKKRKQEKFKAVYLDSSSTFMRMSILALLRTGQ
jgi:hypothetical protein